MFLTPDEIAALTNRVRRRAQCDVLRQLGIPFKIRPDGSPVVLRAAMEAALGYATKEKRQTSPALRVPASLKLLVREKGKMDQARR